MRLGRTRRARVALPESPAVRALSGFLGFPTPPTFTSLLAFSALLSPGPSLLAQGALLDARAHADLPPQRGPVQVEMEYRILPDPGTQDVPLSALTPEPTRLISLTASVGGRNIPLTLKELREFYWEGTAHLPDGPQSRDSLTLRLIYRVEGAWDEGGRATLPLVAVRWIPQNPTPRTFTATVDVPEGFTVTGSFPTSVLSRPTGAEGGALQVGLQGVPSMLILDVTEGPGPLLSPGRILDLLVVVLLLFMGWMGVRYLRKTAT